jgi:hypothetical protein
MNDEKYFSKPLILDDAAESSNAELPAFLSVPKERLSIMGSVSSKKPKRMVGVLARSPPSKNQKAARLAMVSLWHRMARGLASFGKSARKKCRKCFRLMMNDGVSMLFGFLEWCIQRRTWHSISAMFFLS